MQDIKLKQSMRRTRKRRKSAERARAWPTEIIMKMAAVEATLARDREAGEEAGAGAVVAAATVMTAGADVTATTADSGFRNGDGCHHSGGMVLRMGPTSDNGYLLSAGALGFKRDF